MARGTLPLLILAVAGPRAAAAQRDPAAAQRSCVVRIDSTGREAVFFRQPGGDYRAFVGGGVWGHCANDTSTTMSADSLAWYPDRNEAHFLRNVHFRDSTSLLQADRLTYWVRQERLYAEGRVYTRNLRSGSEMRGPNLDYLRAHPALRDTAELYATRRPTIRFRASGDSLPADTSEPFVIVADRARMRGSHRMWGGGRVTVDRSDVAARGDSAWLDLGVREGLLLGGEPSVEGRGDSDFRLTGDRIRFELDEERELRRVVAQGRANSSGRDWRLRSDTLDLALDGGRVERALAWGRALRPDAVSGSYTVVADSLDIRMPGQTVRDVWAFGDGRATTRDSALGEDDWMTGDTLHAVFVEPDSVVPDSAGRRRQEIRRLAAFGSARALYHIVGEVRNERPGVNYSRGRRIAIEMREGRVSTVDVVGAVDGVYLEPVRRARVEADSTRTAPPPALPPRTGAAGTEDRR